MSVDDFKGQGQLSALVRLPELVLQHFVEAAAPVASTQRREPLRVQIAPQLCQLLQQPLWRGKGQPDALHVHHRLGKARLDQHVTPIVHVGEGVTRQGPVHGRVERAQLVVRDAAEETHVVDATRELAQQVAQEAIRLVRFVKGVRIANCAGSVREVLEIANFNKLFSMG